MDNKGLNMDKLKTDGTVDLRKNNFGTGRKKAIPSEPVKMDLESLKAAKITFMDIMDKLNRNEIEASKYKLLIYGLRIYFQYCSAVDEQTEIQERLTAIEKRLKLKIV